MIRRIHFGHNNRTSNSAPHSAGIFHGGACVPKESCGGDETHRRAVLPIAGMSGQNNLLGSECRGETFWNTLDILFLDYARGMTIVRAEYPLCFRENNELHFRIFRTLPIKTDGRKQILIRIFLMDSMTQISANERNRLIEIHRIFLIHFDCSQSRSRSYSKSPLPEVNIPVLLSFGNSRPDVSKFQSLLMSSGCGSVCEHSRAFAPPEECSVRLSKRFLVEIPTIRQPPVLRIYIRRSIYYRYRRSAVSNSCVPHRGTGAESSKDVEGWTSLHPCSSRKKLSKFIVYLRESEISDKSISIPSTNSITLKPFYEKGADAALEEVLIHTSSLIREQYF